MWGRGARGRLAEPSRGSGGALKAYTLGPFDLDHMPVVDDHLHDAIAPRTDVLANQLKPAGFSGCFLGSLDLGWPAHGVWRGRRLDAALCSWLTGARGASPWRAFGQLLCAALSFSTESFPRAIRRDALKRPSGGSDARIPLIGPCSRMDLGLGLDPEFQVSSVRPSSLFPKMVSAVGNFVVRYDFSAHSSDASARFRWSGRRGL
jgi:hypothetical protein